MSCISLQTEFQSALQSEAQDSECVIHIYTLMSGRFWPSNVNSMLLHVLRNKNVQLSSQVSRLLVRTGRKVKKLKKKVKKKERCYIKLLSLIHGHILHTNINIKHLLAIFPSRQLIQDPTCLVTIVKWTLLNRHHWWHISWLVFFYSSKFSSKIKYVNSLRELGEIIPMEYVHIPPSIIRWVCKSPPNLLVDTLHVLMMFSTNVMLISLFQMNYSAWLSED